MKKTIYIFGIVASVMLTQASARDVQLIQALVRDVQMPSFLPDYFVPAFKVGGKQLHLKKQSVKNGQQQFSYATKDQSVHLSVMQFSCDRVRCEAIFKNILRSLNDKIRITGGEFREIT